MLIDLQVHSLYSDGYLQPARLAAFLSKKGVKVAALTDHNTTAGQLEFREACRNYGIKTVTGLELYVRHNNRSFNLLWYNYDENNEELQAMLASTWKRRRGYVKKVTERLLRMGFKLDLENFFKKHPFYTPANHLSDLIAKKPFNQRLITKGLGVKDIGETEIMSYCLFPKRGARLHDAHVSFTRILKIRKSAGGQLIFCHPGLHNKMRGGIIESLSAMGLDGLELLSPHHGYNTIAYLENILFNSKLIATGGSDFHRDGEIAGYPKRSWDYFMIDSAFLPGVNKVIGGFRK